MTRRRKYRFAEIFETVNHKLSGKRIIGTLGSIEGFYLAFMTQWNHAISETLILGILTASFALIGSSLAEKKHFNNLTENE